MENGDNKKVKRGELNALQRSMQTLTDRMCSSVNKFSLTLHTYTSTFNAQTLDQEQTENEKKKNEPINFST